MSKSNLILQLKVNKIIAEEIKSGTIKYEPYLSKNNNIISGIESKSHTSFIRPSSNINSSELHKECDYDDILIRDYKTLCPKNMNEWPQKTNLRCWYCSLYFNTMPIKIPYKYDENTDLFHVYGCFCSFNCAMKKNEIETSNLHKDKINSLLHLLYKRMYGEVKYINPSPDKELLKEYGGNLTKEEYKNIIDNNIESSKILLPPIVDIGYSAGLQTLPETKKNQSLGNMLGYSLTDKINTFESSSVMNNFIKFN